MQPIKVKCSYIDSCYGKIFIPKMNIFVKLFSGNYQVFEFIVDSGADCTIVPRGMAQLVGLFLPAKPDTYMNDAGGGKTPAYKGTLNIKLQGETLDLRCLFVDKNTSPLLLGRLDFFDKFNVLFKNSTFEITKPVVLK